MGFTWPSALLLLFFVPLFAGLYLAGLGRRRRYRLVYSSTSIVGAAAGAGPGIRRHIPPALYLLGLAAMAIGLSRPYASFPDLEATGTIILVIDASQSMLATDVAPTRIDAAKVAIRDFAAKQPNGIRIGVVAFSAGATLLTPPTTDRKQVQSAVTYLTLGRGTNIGDGLQVALNTILDPTGQDETNFPSALPNPLSNPALPNETPRRTATLPNDPRESLVVLLSDGASTVGPSPVAVAQELSRLGVRVYTVGLGTKQVEQGFGFRGSRELDESTLRAVADETGGKYYSASNASKLHEVYGDIATHHELIEEHSELTFLAVAFAIVFSMAGGVLGTLWFARLP